MFEICTFAFAIVVAASIFVIWAWLKYRRHVGAWPEGAVMFEYGAAVFNFLVLCIFLEV